MDTNPNNTPNETPSVPPEELKMPEEQFGPVESQSRASGALIPLMVGILILLLGVLAALIFWGEEIMGILQPAPETVPDPIPAAEMQTMDDEEAANAVADENTSTSTDEIVADAETELEGASVEESATLQATSTEVEGEVVTQ